MQKQKAMEATVNKNLLEPWQQAIDKDLPISEHLRQLRRCLLICAGVLTLAMAGSFYFIETIITVLTREVGQLYYMRPAEAFVIYMKVAFLSGLLLSSPVIFYELYSFVQPALTLREKRFVLFTLPTAVLACLGGMAFSYYFVFPRALEFFLGFAAGKVAPMISMEAYLDLMLMLVVPFGFVFDIPFVVLALAHLHIINVRKLQGYHRHVILAAFIIAAFITPTPDIITQSLLALPMIILYEISVLLCRVLVKSA